MEINANMEVLIPQAELTPMGPKSASKRFKVAGIFRSGFYVQTVRNLLSLRAVRLRKINVSEFTVRDRPA